MNCVYSSTTASHWCCATFVCLLHWNLLSAFSLWSRFCFCYIIKTRTVWLGLGGCTVTKSLVVDLLWLIWSALSIGLNDRLTLVTPSSVFVRIWIHEWKWHMGPQWDSKLWFFCPVPNANHSSYLRHEGWSPYISWDLIQCNWITGLVLCMLPGFGFKSNCGQINIFLLWVFSFWIVSAAKDGLKLRLPLNALSKIALAAWGFFSELYKLLGACAVCRISYQEQNRYLMIPRSKNTPTGAQPRRCRW